MNNKFILGLWFVLFASAVLFVNWLFTRPLQQIDALHNKLADTEKYITRLTALHAEFLLNFDKEDQFFVSTSSSAETEAKSIITAIEQNLEGYRNIRYLKRNPDIVASLDDCAKALTGFGNNLNDLFQVTRERGSFKSGLISRWQDLSSRMLAVSNPPGPEITRKLYLIKQAESSYLLQHESRFLEDISVWCEEIRSQLLPEEGGIEMADLDSYMAITGSFIALDKRIGSANTEGIMAGLSESLKELPLTFDNARNLIHDTGVKIRFWWNLSRFFILFLFVATCIILFNRISGTRIFHPLKLVSGYAMKLSRGELPEEKLTPARLPDLITLQESLKKLVSDLRAKVDFTRALNESNIESHLSMSGESDDLGRELIELQQKLLQTAKEQSKNEEENLKRRYINEGLAKFGDTLRSKSNDLNALGDAFIREVVKYLNAIQGGFFIYDDTTAAAPVLTLISAFAYNRKKYLQASIAFGEGLVGTCAREKQTINLTEIPAGYISITSGLGDTLPDNLLLVPVLHEDEIIGVLEIASLNKFKDHEIAFAEEVANSLGATIVYTRNNQRTADLLEKSQQQALEMAEQEEEMRQNMEELKATQEESSRREEEFKGIADAINQTLFVIEYDLDGIIRDVNERFCNFLGRPKDEIVGHRHREIFAGSLEPDHHFWNDVQKKTRLTVQDEIRIGKITYKLLQHFTTVHNRDGMTVKFINFASDGRIGNS